MIVTKGAQACIIVEKNELIYSTTMFTSVTEVTPDFFVIEEKDGAIVLVYLSSLVVKFDTVSYHKIIPKCGVLIYEEIFKSTLGVLYDIDFNRIAWFIQEEDELIFRPQGRNNILYRSYVVKGFNKSGSLILEDRNLRVGLWNADQNKINFNSIDIEIDVEL